MAKYLADNGIYFTFQYVDWLDNPTGFDEEISQAMKEVAGKYYRAHGLGELGTKFGCAARGYGDFYGRPNGSTTMQEGKDGFDEYVKKVVERGSFGGTVDTFVTDATSLLSYAAPFTAFPALELVCGNPEIMVPQIRALARAYASDCWSTYDIVPATAGYEAFKRYDYLIFTGWNTMTYEIYEELKKFVSNGGRLFMCTSHLNTSAKRDGEIKLVKGGKVSELFGCDLDSDNKICTNDGIKYYESIVPEFMWPASTYFNPIFSEGYINYAKANLKGGTMSGFLSNSFKDKEPETLPAALVENKYGDGYAVLMTNLDYPGCAGYSAYKALVREILTASHRLADIKIYGGDKLRFTVYEGNKVYLLNTDFDCQVQAIIDTGDKRLTYTLEPMEFKIIEPEELK